jgi:hypothetical protein
MCVASVEDRKCPAEAEAVWATRKRHAHRLANKTTTDVQNEQQKRVHDEAQNKAQ